MNDLNRLSDDQLRAHLERLTAQPGLSDETRGLIHQLDVHQIELEMQNRELREAQQALEESRDRYAGLYDLAPVGYLTLDRRGTIRELNLTAAAMLGTERTHLDGASLLTWTDPADQPRLLAHLRAGFLPGMVTGVDLRLRLRNGELRHVRLQTLYVEDPEHATQVCRTAMIDSTDHERAQAALRASEQRFRATFENAAVGMALVSLDGRLLRVNQRLCAITGYAEAELTGKPHRDITDPADVAHEVEQAGRLHAGEIASYSLEKRYRRKDGSIVWVHVTAALQTDNEGLPDHFVAVIEDITARKAAEDALRNADQRKDEFLLMLGHELRNPLAPIRSAAEALREGPTSDPGRVRWAADIIARQVEHMTRLVDDLLDVSRITRGSIRLQKAPFDLREAIELAAEQARPRLAARRQTLDLALPPTAVRVQGDPVRLAQVIANLLVNASKFSPPEARVDLRLEEAQGHARVQVCDRGAGIAADMLQRIFEPFVQAPQPGERSPDGIGLGLALSRGLALMHGGELEAESPGLGQGSTFTLRLPLGPSAPPPAPAPAPESPPEPAAPARGRGLVILIVDDNRDVAESSAMLLGLAGHEAHTAGDGEAALAAIESLHPDVVLLDIGLPGMDGFEVARRLRRTAAGARATILAVSGYDVASRPAQEGEALFDGQLLKPVGLKTLLATIEGCRRGGTTGS